MKYSSVLDKNRDVMGESVHAPIQSNSTYIQTIIWSIYDTI